MDGFWWGVAIAAIAFGVISLFVDDIFDLISGLFAVVFIICLVVSIFSGAFILFDIAFLRGGCDG